MKRTHFNRGALISHILFVCSMNILKSGLLVQSKLFTFFSIKTLIHTIATLNNKVTVCSKMWAVKNRRNVQSFTIIIQLRAYLQIYVLIIDNTLSESSHAVGFFQKPWLFNIDIPIFSKASYPSFSGLMGGTIQPNNWTYPASKNEHFLSCMDIIMQLLYIFKNRLISHLVAKNMKFNIDNSNPW